MNTAQTDVRPPAKTHATLSPRTNLLLVFVWAIAVVLAFSIVQPRLPFTLGLAGGLLGAVAGVMQHLSMSQDPKGFIAASSLMGVRRALSSTLWGRRYIGWLYFSKLILFLIAFVMIRGPLFRVLFGYLAAYFSLMLIRDVVTLRNTYALHRLAESADSLPPTV